MYGLILVVIIPTATFRYLGEDSNLAYPFNIYFSLVLAILAGTAAILLLKIKSAFWGRWCPKVGYIVLLVRRTVVFPDDRRHARFY
jgi:hypothetical protein